MGQFGARSGLMALAVAVLLCASVLVHPIGAAHADLFFCEDDPIVNINGVNISLTAGIAQDGLSHLHGSVPIIIIVPDSVPAHLVASTHQFLDEQVVIVHAGDAERTIRSVLHGDQRDDALGALRALHQSGTVLALSDVFTGGEHEYVTRFYSDQSPLKTYGRSNHLMQLSFAVPHAHVTPFSGAGIP
jgi:hypothetical protein